VAIPRTSCRVPGVSDRRVQRSCCACTARCFNLAWRYSWCADPDPCLDRALELATAAIRHDDLDARAHSELAYAHLYRKEHGAALAAYKRALELNPNDADIIAEYADALVYEDQPQQSISLLERAMRLNPYHPDWYLWHLADAYSVLRQHEDVIATVQKMRDPSEGRRLLAASYAHLGMLEEARFQARELLFSEYTPISPFYLGRGGRHTAIFRA
jgi:adenylate cyclase